MRTVIISTGRPEDPAETEEWERAKIDQPQMISIDEVTRWLVELGYGYDFTSDAPLPEALRRPLAEAYYADDHTNGIDDHSTVDDYYTTLAEECGW